MNDEMIMNRGGDENEIKQYAEKNGADLDQEDLQEEVYSWLQDNVYRDNGVTRPVLYDEDSDRLFFPAYDLDFDKDDSPVSKYYLDEFEGWKPEYQDIIEISFLG